MPTEPLLLALCAALVHAGWNLLISRARDSEAATAVALGAGAIAFAPVAAATWRVDSAALPYAAGSAALELVYLAMLARAYQEGELSVVYPIARGSSPLLILVFSLAVLGHSLSAAAVIGIVLVATGVVAVRGRNSATSARDVGLALAIGLCIASYTLLDKQGLEHASPLAYLQLVVAVPALIYVPAFAHHRGAAALRAELSSPSLLAGLGMFGAFGLALAAIKLAPSASLAAVQAVRESSVVIAVVLARVLLGERVTGVRLAGALAVVAGVAAIAAA
ncbi:MAG TPA: EamA family transporter [Candidatus Dormibacteraeota bacterium]|nr:EamA family transporter [Candidatus Dormibacteraeota bacterium]